MTQGKKTPIPKPEYTGFVSFTYQLYYSVEWRERFLSEPDRTMAAFKLTKLEREAAKGLAAPGAGPEEGARYIGCLCFALHQWHIEPTPPEFW